MNDLTKDINNVLITGCGGMLGEAVYKRFTEEFENVLATDIDLNSKWLKELDVRLSDNFDKTLANFEPDLMVHLAALTDLEYCELNPQDAFDTIVTGTVNALENAKKLNIPFINISTAGVFDGTKDVHVETDTPNPLNVYGKSKYEAEQYIQDSYDKWFTIRAGWMMGGGPKKDKKFINKIFKQIYNGADELKVVDDKFGTPTYTNDLAKCMVNILERGQYGTYHVSCEGIASRYTVAEEFLKILGLSEKIKLTKIKSSDIEKEYFAHRPEHEELENTKLKALEINDMRDWKVSLEEYSQLFKEELENAKI